MQYLALLVGCHLADEETVCKGCDGVADRVVPARVPGAVGADRVVTAGVRTAKMNGV